MRVKKIVLVFITLFLPLGNAFPGVFEKYTAQQDPLVEEAIRLFGKTSMIYDRALDVIWKVWEIIPWIPPPTGPTEQPDFATLIQRLKAIEEELAGRQPSQAIVDTLLKYAYIELDDWEFECLNSSGALDESSRAKRFFETPRGRSVSLPYNPLYRKEIIKFFKKAEAYDPDMYISFVWIRDTDEVYYMVNGSPEEVREWNKEVDKRVEPFRKQPYKVIRNEVAPLYGWVGEAYLAEGDFPNAIYYLECMERYWEVEFTRLTGARVMRAQGSEALAGVRALYLQQLKKKNKEDTLHPFIYLNGKPLDSKKGLTKEGQPYVSLTEFSKAIGASVKWVKKNKLLSVEIGDTNLLIANIRGQWKIYKNEGKININACLRDGELYLALKELCQLLNLRLHWDNETFVAWVGTK